MPLSFASGHSMVLRSPWAYNNKHDPHSSQYLYNMLLHEEYIACLTVTSYSIPVVSWLRYAVTSSFQ